MNWETEVESTVALPPKTGEVKVGDIIKVRQGIQEGTMMDDIVFNSIMAGREEIQVMRITEHRGNMAYRDERTGFWFMAAMLELPAGHRFWDIQNNNTEVSA
jgi:hypothetical protein